jgi:hypothetical protein
VFLRHGDLCAPEQAKGERVDHRADIFRAAFCFMKCSRESGLFKAKTVIDVRIKFLRNADAFVNLRPDRFRRVFSNNR